MSLPIFASQVSDLKNESDTSLASEDGVFLVNNHSILAHESGLQLTNALNNLQPNFLIQKVIHQLQNILL